MFPVTVEHWWRMKSLTCEDSFGSIKNSFSLFFSPPTWKRSYFIPKKEKKWGGTLWKLNHNNNQNNKRQRAVTREREICQYCKIIYSVLSKNKYYIMQSSAGMKTFKTLSRPTFSLEVFSLLIPDGLLSCAVEFPSFLLSEDSTPGWLFPV